MDKQLLKYTFFTFTIIIGLATLVPHTQGFNQTLDKPSSLVPSHSTILKYHGGPLLTGKGPLNIYLIWYGSFDRNDKAPITDFLSSIAQKKPNTKAATVQGWWGTILSYKDRVGNRVARDIRVAEQIDDNYSLGKNIKRTQIGTYVESKIAKLDPHGIYLVLTSKNVIVEKFCMNSCGYHDTIISPGKARVIYAHVGDPSTQCPGLCAWPYALPAYGPPGKALVAPNGVGADGMVINIATILAGAVTNPYKSGYYLGDMTAPLEAASACSGIFGPGAYPGYPGDLMEDKVSRASYNAYGINRRKFLLPSVWDPKLKSCKA